MSEANTGARAAAVYALGRCRRFDAWSPQVLPKAAEKFALSQRDRALCTRLCLCVLQNAALCDHYITAYSAVPAQKLEPQVRDILRLGVCQLLFMDKIPVSAAVSESVELCKRTAPRAAGLCNAVLRRVAENRSALPPLPQSGTAEELSVRYSHPLWLCQRLLAELGEDETRQFLALDNTEPGLTLTVDPLRTTPEKLLTALTERGLTARQSTLSPLSLELSGAGDVTDLPGFAQGWFFVQDAAAALAVCAAGPKPGERVLDGCAAPGGKSLLCALLMEDKGEVLSCDLHEKKLARIEENAQRLGLSCIQTAPMDAAKPYAAFQGSFDLVLADVPCSGLGVIRKKPEIRYKAQADIAALPAVQGRILRGLATCVKPGGRLLYSTCTILREENEDVVHAFCREDPRFTVTEARTLWPQRDGTDGFFICCLQRNAE